MVERDINILSKKEYYDVLIKYGKINNYSDISNFVDAIHDVWNAHNHNKVPDRKRGKVTKKFITEDDIIEMTSKKYSTNLRETISEKEQKHNVSLTMFHESNIKILEDSLVANKPDVLKLIYRSYLKPVHIINKKI